MCNCDNSDFSRTGIVLKPLPYITVVARMSAIVNPTSALYHAQAHLGTTLAPKQIHLFVVVS